MWLFQENDSSTITLRYLKDLFCSRRESPYDIWTSLAVLTALCDAITIVTIFFVLQIRPLLANHWLMLLRSLSIMYLALPTSLEIKWISVSSANSATPELWHPLDMLFIWILRTQDRSLRDSKREMSKLRRAVSTYNKFRSA